MVLASALRAGLAKVRQWSEKRERERSWRAKCRAASLYEKGSSGASVAFRTLRFAHALCAPCCCCCSQIEAVQQRNTRIEQGTRTEMLLGGLCFCDCPRVSSRSTASRCIHSLQRENVFFSQTHTSSAASAADMPFSLCLVCNTSCSRSTISFWGVCYGSYMWVCLLLLLALRCQLSSVSLAAFSRGHSLLCSHVPGGLLSSQLSRKHRHTDSKRPYPFHCCCTHSSRSEGHTTHTVAAEVPGIAQEMLTPALQLCESAL